MPCLDTSIDAYDHAKILTAQIYLGKLHLTLLNVALTEPLSSSQCQI